jgi:hypothetical protein
METCREVSDIEVSSIAVDDNERWYVVKGFGIQRSRVRRTQSSTAETSVEQQQSLRVSRLERHLDLLIYPYLYQNCLGPLGARDCVFDRS